MNMSKIYIWAKIARSITQCLNQAFKLQQELASSYVSVVASLQTLEAYVVGTFSLVHPELDYRLENEQLLLDCLLKETKKTQRELYLLGPTQPSPLYGLLFSVESLAELISEASGGSFKIESPTRLQIQQLEERHPDYTLQAVENTGAGFENCAVFAYNDATVVQVDHAAKTITVLYI